MPPPALFFDLDGTLTDPRQGIVRSFQHALRGLGIADLVSESEIETFIGPPLHATFERVLERAGLQGATPADGVALYREHFTDRGLFENRVYDDIPEQLEALGDAGHRLLVVTSKPAVYAERILSHFSLRHHFRGVHGPDLQGRLADKTELIASVLARERIAADEALMIGDRSHDVLGAQANGIRAIGVLWGYGGADELRDAGAWRLCAAPSDLPSTISA